MNPRRETGFPRVELLGHWENLLDFSVAFQRISIIAQTYNEMGNVIPFIDSVKNALNSFDWEILFVDDSSSDGTAKKVFECAKDSPRIRLIHRVDDRGLAKPSIQGMLSAKGDLLCVMDAVGQHVPRIVAQLAEGRLDIVSAARKLGNTGRPVGLSPLRNAISRLGNWLSAFTLGHKLSDPFAATSNSLLNNLLTFRNRHLRGRQQLWGYAKFLAISSIGIVANISAASITYERLVHVVFLAMFAGIAIDVMWKFLVANKFIWR